MAIQSYEHEVNDVFLQHIVPAGCTPRTDTYKTNVAKSLRWSDNPIERRPYPDDPLASMTSQAQQFRKEENSPYAIYPYGTIPCPHGGVHGPTEIKLHTRYINYHTPWSLSRHSSDLWSSRLREELESLKVNMGTTVAEYRASARMFGDFATKLKGAHDVLRGRMPRRKLRACSIPAAYLQYTFGIGPLASDLFDSVEVLRLRLQLPIRRRISVFNAQNLSGENTVGDQTYRWTSRKSQRATCYVTLDPNQINPIHLGNPVEWAWELIPFSFVVDWAIPIGDWLHSLDAVRGITNVTGTVTEKVKYKAVVEQPYSYGGDALYASHKRDVVTSIPLPPPPKWNPSKSLKAVRNGLFLLWGINKRCRKG